MKVAPGPWQPAIARPLTISLSGWRGRRGGGGVEGGGRGGGGGGGAHSVGFLRTRHIIMR